MLKLHSFIDRKDSDRLFNVGERDAAMPGGSGRESAREGRKGGQGESVELHGGTGPPHRVLCSRAWAEEGTHIKNQHQLLILI